MQQKQINELEKFPMDTYGDKGLGDWQDARNLREYGVDSDCDEILRLYVDACSHFIKHIFDHSKGFIELIANVDWIKYVANDRTSIESRRSQDTKIVQTLLKFCLEDEGERDSDILHRGYTELCKSFPYDFSSDGGLYNCIDELIYHLYLKAKEVDRKWYTSD